MTPRVPSAYVVTITPFDERGALDESALALLLDRIAGAGVGVCLGSASPGEGHALSPHETERLYLVAKEAVGGRASVRAMGAEPRSAEELLRTIRVAEDVGVDAMQLYSVDLGHANRPSDAELEGYFRTLLEGMRIPAVISSHQAGGYVIPVEILGRLLDDHPHLIGINVTSADLAYVARVVETVDGRADVHVGGPMQALSILALGGQGFLCTEGLFAPRLVASVIEHFRAGRLAETFAAYRTLIRFFAAESAWPGGSIRFTKAAMRVLGLPGWHARPPYLALPDDVLPRVEAMLAAAGIPEIDELLAARGS
jgi:4-hydroxy-tetrahydrodipicolinate synthase